MDVTARNDWLAKMNGIYSKFDADMAAAEQEGMTADPVMERKHGGYMICFGMHSSLTDQVADFAHKAKTLVPSLAVYEGDILHTTLSTFKVSDGFMPHESEDHASTLKKLARAIVAAQGVRMRAKCTPDGFVFNKTTGILKGTPGGAFLVYAHAIIIEAQKEGMELRLPWGGHTTFARATKPITPGEVKKLAELCRTTPFGKSADRCMNLEVGFFFVSQGKFNVEFTSCLPLFDD